MKNWILLLAFSIVLGGCSTSNDKYTTEVESTGTGGDLINLDVKKKVLDNGMKVLVYENDQLPIVSLYFFYDVGGRHESREEKTTGATHFLEHMMFKGAKKYGPHQFDSIIESSGGMTNAYTTFDSTVYYESFPSESFEKIIDMEADRMENLLLHPGAFENERNVIFEERKYRYENSPKGKLYLKMMQEMFKGTPYGGSVIGDVRDLKALTRDQLMSFFKRFYVPNNVIMVVAGDVDADDVFSLAKKKFGHMKKSEDIIAFKKEREVPELYKSKAKMGKSYKINATSKVPIFSIAYPGEPLGTRKSFVMDILSSILGDGNSSYLVQKYVKSKKPLLNRVGVSNYNLKFNGTFYVMGDLLKGVSLKTFRRRFNRDAKKICKEAINQRSLQKTKNQYMISYYDEIKTNAGIASFIGLRENFMGDYNHYKKELETYASITEEEVREVCHDIFKKNEHIFVSVWEKHPKR